MDFGKHYLENAGFELGRLKRLAEAAMEQIPEDAGFHIELDDASNSIAVILQHLSGNMVSRWTDFLTSDGEKPDRHRDREFVAQRDRTRDELMALWERGWSTLFASFNALTPQALERNVTIRGEALTVPEAIQRQVVHVAYHVGQIVYLARHSSAKSGWKSVSIPKESSENAKGGYKTL